MADNDRFNEPYSNSFNGVGSKIQNLTSAERRMLVAKEGKRVLFDFKVIGKKVPVQTVTLVQTDSEDF